MLVGLPLVAVAQPFVPVPWGVTVLVATLAVLVASRSGAVRNTSSDTCTRAHS